MIKRGQVTLFVILGIILLSIVLVILYITTQTQQIDILQEKYQLRSLTEQSKEIVSIFESCTKRLLQEGILYTSIRGGYYVQPPTSVVYANGFIPLYLNAKKENVPSLSTIESSIATYVEENIDKCLTGDNAKIQVTKAGKPKASVKVKAKGTELLLKAPILISEDKLKTKMSVFRVKTESDLKEAYNSALELYGVQKKADQDTFLSELNSFAFNKKINFYLDVHNGTVLYFIKYNKTRLLNKELVFAFGIKMLITSNDTLGLDLKGITGEDDLFKEEENKSSLELSGDEAVVQAQKTINSTEVLQILKEFNEVKYEV